MDYDKDKKNWNNYIFQKNFVFHIQNFNFKSNIKFINIWFHF